MSSPGKEDIFESSSILKGREESKCLIEANYDILLEKYGEKEVIAVYTGEKPEIAAVYNLESENNWRQALSAIKETYGELGYHTSVAGKLER